MGAGIVAGVVVALLPEIGTVVAIVGIVGGAYAIMRIITGIDPITGVAMTNQQRLNGAGQLIGGVIGRVAGTTIGTAIDGISTTLPFGNGTGRGLRLNPTRGSVQVPGTPAADPFHHFFPQRPASADADEDHRLTYAREKEKLGMHQWQLAKILGVWRSTLGSWEANHYQPESKVRDRVVALLGFDPRQLNE